MITLNNDQQRCKEEILNTINTKVTSEEPIYHTLKGAAGTGKTTLVSNIISSIPPFKTIGIATPTHKATKVARKMGFLNGWLGERCEYGTIHRFLGLKPIRKDDKEIYTRDNSKEEMSFDVLFIDEASMLGEEIIDFILKCESKCIIFIGDEYQICPVNSINGTISEVFESVDIVSNLTKIVRHDNPIINLATKLREWQKNNSIVSPKFNTDLDENGHGVVALSANVWFYSLINEIKSDNFKNDSDFVRCVAYTNKTVDKLNNQIRRTIHGNNVHQFLEGEIIISQSAKYGYFNNADEFTILKIIPDFDDMYHLNAWELKLKSNEDGKIYFVKTIADSDREKFNKKLEEIKKLAFTDTTNKTYHWNKFWSLKDKYIDFKYIYCCTAHKSQGSTFNKTYVYKDDFLKYGDNLPMKQLLYTSVTRSSEQTVICK